MYLYYIIYLQICKYINKKAFKQIYTRQYNKITLIPRLLYVGVYDCMHLVHMDYTHEISRMLRL